MEIYNTIGDFDSPHSTMDISSRQKKKKNKKKISYLKNTTDQINLINIYRTFHQTVAECMFF